MKKIILGLVFLFLSGCTGAGSDVSIPLPGVVSQPPNPEIPTLPEAEVPAVSDPEFTKPEAAIMKVQTEIVQALNNDPSYEINPTDVELLVSEGIIDSEEQLKGWVK